MGSVSILSVMLLVCLGILILTALAKPLKLLFRILVSAAGGGALIWVCGKLGLAIGINAVTLVIAGILGLPGVLGLIALSAFL